MIIGRNDPCPCGSGKKYKKCCLQKDVAAAPRKSLDFGYESDLAVRRKVVDKLDSLLRETVHQDEVREFVEDFWTPIFADEADIRALRADDAARGPLERQLPIAIRNAILVDEAFPADYFLDHAPERFTSAERDFLRRFAEARITFIQLREFFPEAGYTLVEDLFDGREYKVFDKAFSRSGSPHAIVSARLVPLPDGRGHVLEQVGLGVFFPADKAVIVPTLEAAARSFSEGERGKASGRMASGGKVPPEAVHAMLREEPMYVYGIEVLMACRNLAAKSPRLANTDGDPWLQVEARYRCDDPQALKAALLAQPNIAHECIEGADVFTWTNRQDTLIGLARMDSGRGELVAETNSRARHRKWEKKLQSLGRLTLLEKRETPMDLESIPESAPKSAAGSSKVKSIHAPLSGRDLEAVLPQIKAHLAERWLKESIPALGGKTPVQAAKSAQGRKQLRELFDHIESMEARRPAGSMEAGWDVGEMKKRLGLPED